VKWRLFRSRRTTAGVMRLASEANALMQSYITTGNPDSLAKAASHWRVVVQHSEIGAQDQRFKATVNVQAATAFLRLSELWGKREDIDFAIELLKRGRREAPVDMRPAIDGMLGVVFMQRFETSRQLDELEDALELLKRAASVSHADADWPIYCYNLCVALQNIYELTGEGERLDESISRLDSLVKETGRSSPELPGYLNVLGVALRERGDRDDSGTDIEKSIAILHDSVKLTPEGSIELPLNLNSLGLSLVVRYQRTGDLVDLERGILALRRSISLTPRDSSGWQTSVANLGTACRTVRQTKGLAGLTRGDDYTPRFTVDALEQFMLTRYCPRKSADS
jgi:tetratricopeptide (TPR) repeat protein